MSRLRWKCRRGMLELDLLLQGFLDEGYAELDEHGRAAFEALLALPDQTLFELLVSGAPSNDEAQAALIGRIRNKFPLGEAKKD